MEVRFELPNDLFKYVEFVPEEELPTMFIQLLRDRIQETSGSFNTEQPATQNLQDSLRDILQDLLSSNNLSLSVPHQEVVLAKEAVEEKVVEKETIVTAPVVKKTISASFDLSDDDDDDFADLLDMMK